MLILWKAFQASSSVSSSIFKSRQRNLKRSSVPASSSSLEFAIFLSVQAQDNGKRTAMLKWREKETRAKFGNSHNKFTMTTTYQLSKTIAIVVNFFHIRRLLPAFSADGIMSLSFRMNSDHNFIWSFSNLGIKEKLHQSDEKCF